MSRLAKPMICPNFRIGSPFAIGTVAILWPRMIRSVAVTCSTVTPVPIISIQTMTLSLGCNRTVRAILSSMVLSDQFGWPGRRQPAKLRIIARCSSTAASGNRSLGVDETFGLEVIPQKPGSALSSSGAERASPGCLAPRTAERRPDGQAEIAAPHRSGARHAAGIPPPACARAPGFPAARDYNCTRRLRPGLSQGCRN